MQKANKLRILVSNQRKSTKVLILENNSAIASPTDMITSCIKQPEKGYLGSSCVIWAQCQERTVYTHSCLVMYLVVATLSFP